MATIHCKACGAIYRYEKEGCCPRCGAYNRPPKRERVNADGTVQHMTDAAYEKRQHAQGKVCFEEKACYEDQTRISGKKPHSSHGGTTDSFDRVRTTTGAKLAGKNAGKKTVGWRVVLIILALLGAVGTGWNYLDREKTPAVELEPEIIEEPDDVDLGWTDAAMGEELTLSDGAILTVRAVGVDDDNISVYLEIESADSDHDLYATLVCLDREGEEVYLDEFTTGEDGGIRLDFPTEDQTDLEPLYLAVQEWNEDDYINTWFIALQ